MLANTLSVEDEEAVQTELRELEAEAVRSNTCVYIVRFANPSIVHSARGNECR